MLLQTFLLIFSIIVASGMCFYAWRNPQARGSRAFAFICLSGVIWLLGDLLILYSSTLTAQHFGEFIRYIGKVTIPVSSLVFTIQFSGRQISVKKIFLLLLVPAISLLMLITNNLHGLFFSSMAFDAQGILQIKYGTYFWLVHIPFSYTLILGGLILVVFELSRVTQRFRTQFTLLFISMFLPLVVNFFVISGMITNIDPTPISFTLFIAVSGYGIFRYQFLRSTPIAYETVFQISHDGVFILNQNNIVMDINDTAAKILNKNRSEIIGLDIYKTFENWREDFSGFDDLIESKKEIKTIIENKTYFYSINTTPIEDSNGIINGRIMTIRDVTADKHYQMSLETLAFQDPLTRVANRRKFQQEVEIAIEEAEKTNKQLAILYFDMNGFKTVNDTMGHEIGDELLKYVATRISSVLRKSDVLARLGGDEFAVLLHDSDEKNVEFVVERILEKIERPFKVDKMILKADLSIGAAFYPKDGDDFNQLLRHADSAMYRAKTIGGGLIMYGSVINSSNLPM